ncbi:unnamed protein product [Bursaphelenchus xylophilus]|uniref:(pine wood nematode) hypothetical protein n=1 Tax=Bursaphelenchus xylophilus TaxID=6326 RepID=A0A7I8X159_BURXY|nr:unnamed protein product [Bursaphelenchus xylophilus]CAG9130351.1 unnamed protein product [Bursaphelenchus xylophilus]
MVWFQQCMCFRKEDKDSNIYYTASRPTRRQNEADGTPGSQSSNKNVQKSRRKLFFALKRKPPPASNPPVPQQERQHFNPDDIPNIDDPIPTYESVDATDSDIAYSVNGRPRRYDYPTFKSRTNEEAVYASASQIYSGGSEDPYSSIVSDIEGSRQRGDDTSVGYARVAEDAMKPSTSRPIPARNVESLYAKINRNAVNKKINEASTSLHPPGLQLLPQAVSYSIPSTSIQVQPTPAIVPSNTPVFDPNYQYDESGSGSITSNGSRNPSYKYLTVRETLGAIRERIRAREEGILETPRVGREHYYSTINNDYETVKDLRPLNVVTDTKTNPRPPTSPVPNHIPTMT